MAKYLTDRSEATLRELVRDWRSGGFAQSGNKPAKRQLPAIQEIAIGVTSEVIAPGDSGDVIKWTVNSGGDFTGTSEVLTAYDWYLNGIDQDVRVVLARVAHDSGTRWVAMPASSSTGLVLVQLDGTLSAGGSASAIVMVWTGSVWDDTGATITVHDSTDKLSGSAGDKFWVKFQSASSRWEIVSPGESSSTPPPVLWSGEKTTSLSFTGSSGVQLTLTQVNTSGGITHSTGAGYSEVTVPEDAYYRLTYGYRATRPADTTSITHTMMFAETHNGSSWSDGTSNSRRASVTIYKNDYSASETWSPYKSIVVPLNATNKIRLTIGSEASSDWDLLSAHLQVEKFGE